MPSLLPEAGGLPAGTAQRGQLVLRDTGTTPPHHCPASAAASPCLLVKSRIQEIRAAHRMLPASLRPRSRLAWRWRGWGSARARCSQVIRSCRITAGVGSGPAARRCKAQGDEVGGVNLLICL